MPGYRIDWQAIKDKYLDNDLLVFVLPRHYQQLLLSTIDALTYRASYRLPGYDYSDWDTLRAVVDNGNHALMDFIMLSDIIGYIDEIETLLADLIAKTGCCPPDGTVTYFPVPDEELTGWESDGETYPETYADVTMTSANMYHLYLCGAANKLVDNLILGAQNVNSMALAGVLVIAAVAGLLAAISSFGIALAVEWGLITAVYSAISVGFTVGMFDEPMDDLETNRSLVICAALQNDPEVLAAAVETIVGESAWLVWFKWLNYTNMVAALFSGYIAGDPITVEPTDEPCYCAPVYAFDKTWTFDTDSEGWGMSRTTWSSLHGGSIALAPTSAGYAVFNINEDTMLDALVLADGTYITPEIIEIDYYLTNRGDGSALFNNSVFGDTTYDLAQPALSTLSVDVDADYDRSFSTNDALQLTNGSTGQVCRLELTRTAGSPAPVMYIKSIRLAGSVGV